MVKHTKNKTAEAAETKCYHITITSTNDDFKIKVIHFIRQYTDHVYEELFDDGFIDWEDVFSCDIDIETCGYDMDMCDEVITKDTFDSLLDAHCPHGYGMWVWPSKEEDDWAESDLE